MSERPAYVNAASEGSEGTLRLILPNRNNPVEVTLTVDGTTSVYGYELNRRFDQKINQLSDTLHGKLDAHITAGKKAAHA